jgi:DNA replication protein DnaC
MTKTAPKTNVQPDTTDYLAAFDACRELNLTALAPELDNLCTQAIQQRSSYPGFLADTLRVELDIRHERKRARRVHEARLPRVKTLEDFDLTANPNISTQTIAMLRDGTYIDKSEPVVFLGNSGTGKSHLLIAACLAAAENGKRVRYTTCAQLANELCEAKDDNHLSRVVTRYGKLDLLAIDELGYVHLDQQSAELLFQILTEREERASIAIASNAPFSEWTKTFTDPRLAAAVIDRITYKAHIIETGTTSYRLTTTTTR